MDWRRDLRGWSALTLLAIVVGALLTAARPAEPSRVAITQFGLASWYGPGFQGERTASGRPFDQRQLVAAHRTLPLGTIVRVTNLENGRVVRVKIIDRGPYERNRRNGTIIDLSRSAARRLQFLRDGLVRVRVEVIRASSGTPTGTE